MTYNFHTHTPLCHHAVGDPRDYIEAAIRGGITEMGFSDHIPVRFPNGYDSGYRVDVAAVDAYIASLRALRDEYAREITLHIGFEAEYYPRFFDGMLENAKAWGAEYLILGQHFVRNELPPDGFYIGNPHSDPVLLTAYVDEVIAAMHTGVFTYVAHPDIPQFRGDAAHYEHEMRRLCVAARETDTPLEINLLGIRDHRWYPCDRFWRIAGEEGASVVTGCDAHDPAAACDTASLTQANALIKHCRLRTVHPPLRRLCR